MHIFIDGDGCPVKDAVIEIAQKNQVPVKIVTSFSHFTTKELSEQVSFIYVDDGQDAADYRIIKEIQAGDILVTQDYGLAALALSKKSVVLHQTGFEYSADNMDILLESRYFGAMQRKQGKKTKGPKAFTEKDRENFKRLLRTKIQEKMHR